MFGMPEYPKPGEETVGWFPAIVYKIVQEKVDDFPIVGLYALSDTGIRHMRYVTHADSVNCYKLKEEMIAAQKG